MSGISAKSNMREQTISAVITRADGTVEHLGVISYYHKNPLKRWVGEVVVRLRGIWR